jgi:hypothetical protein
VQKFERQCRPIEAQRYGIKSSKIKVLLSSASKVIKNGEKQNRFSYQCSRATRRAVRSGDK